MQFRQGEDRDQITMLPECVDDYVSAENAARVIEAYVNSLDLAKLGFAKTEPNATGCPMYDPRDLLKLYMYGYMNRTRSSRRLETETKRNLEVIWLMRKLSPDHKTIARFRRDNADALKNVFKDFVRLCARLGLYGKELVAIDGSKFKAVNAKDRNFTNKKLKDRIARLDAKIEEYLKQLDEQDTLEDEADTPKTVEEIQQIIDALRERKTRYEEYAEELQESGETQKSLTDGDSRLMLGNGKLDVCYNVQTAVDHKNKMIVEFDITNHAFDVGLLSKMSEMSAEILETDELISTADKGYDSATDIARCMMNGIQPEVCDADMTICIPANASEATEIQPQEKGRCVYIAERNIVLCSMGHVLYPGYYNAEKRRTAFYNYKACKQCTCKCSKDPKFKFHVHSAENLCRKPYNVEGLYIKQVRIKADKQITAKRKELSEHPFGTVKRAMDAGHCLMKGKRNVTGEFALTFLAYNLKRAIKILGAANLIAAART